MTITSSAINNSNYILEEYTCDGQNVNPPLTFSEIPIKAASLALIMDDPDAPGGTFTHWTLYNMSPATLQINEDSLPPSSKQGANSFGRVGYGGPCPPSGKPHRYFFKLFALDKELNLDEGASLETLNKAMEGRVIEQCQIMGIYQRSG